jgi:uncharacterized protein
MRDSGLRESHRFFDVAGAETSLFARDQVAAGPASRFQELENLQPGRVSERFERGNEVGSLIHRSKNIDIYGSLVKDVCIDSRSGRSKKDVKTCCSIRLPSRGVHVLNLLPRDDKYFDQFTDLARRVHDGALAWDKFFKRESPVGAVADQIKRLEHECDEISHEILRRIDRTFITPIDREDIHRLAVRLDDVIDLIDGGVRQLALFGISEPTPQSRRLSEIIVAITAEVVAAVAALEKQKGVTAHCIRIKQLESEGDVGYYEAVASLFREKTEPIELIKWKDVYENMEACIDRCEAVAHVLESVVLKHS